MKRREENLKFFQYGVPNTWNCFFVPLPTLTGVCSKKQREGYKLIDCSFGKFGEGYLRFSCANSEDSIERAIKKLSLFLSEL